MRTSTIKATAKRTSIARRAARKPAPVILTAGQKAAATKRANGLNLSTVAKQAYATRQANRVFAAEQLARAARAAKRAAKRAA